MTPGPALIVTVGLLAAACGAAEAPIEIDGQVIHVRNLTGSDWTDVRIWVNEYYAGTARTIPAGGFVREPASRFVASQGQPFDIVRTPVTSVVVLATDARGERVRIVWGTPVLH